VSLEGRIAVVTGAARGIGRAVALRLHADGATVAAVDIDPAALDEGVPEVALRIALDVTNADEVAALPHRLGGPAAILVNCAGITGDALVHKMSRELYRKVLNINLAGTHMVTEALVPGMKSARFGRIVHFSSRAYLGNVGQANYAASKGAVVAMAKAQALRWGPWGITTNVIAPGLIRTRLTDAIPPDIRQKFIAAIPVGRIGEPEDIAGAVRYLVDPASDFVNGQTLLVCGGRSVGGPIRG
jgi:3-oxoacyl-[acyl-carrier protein] reductase